jgi:hypothetical protein
MTAKDTLRVEAQTEKEIIKKKTSVPCFLYVYGIKYFFLKVLKIIFKKSCCCQNN